MSKIKKINSTTLLETKKQNKYFYDRGKKRFQLCHPLFHFIVKTICSGEKAKLRNMLNFDSFEIENYGSFTREEIKYYFRKFMLLKHNGYFLEIDQEKKLDGKISADTVKRNLANLGEVVFEVTENCNLDCHYCGYGKFYDNYAKRERKNIDIQSAMRLLDYLSQEWNSPLNKSQGKFIDIGFYGGEPLLNISFIKKIVDYVKQKKSLRNLFKFSMTTNGTLIKKYMDFLYENNFWLSISLDGNEKNNEFRVFKNGKPAYSSTMENILALAEKYPDYFLSNVSFISVLHKKNSVSDIYKNIKENFNKTSLIVGLNTFGVKESMKKTFWEMYVNVKQSLHESEDYSLIEKDMFSRLPNVREIRQLLHLCNEFIFSDYNHLIHNDFKNKSLPTGTCLPFEYKIYLTANSKILTCERIGNQFALGYVTPDSVNLDFDKIAKQYNDYYDKMRKQCSVCYNADICAQCLFNLKKIDDNDPICNGFMDEAGYSKYISSFFSYIEENPATISKCLNGTSIVNKKKINYSYDDYWFYIETYVHITIKNNSLLLYNSLTGKILEYLDEKRILNLVRRMLLPLNQQVVRLRKRDLVYPIISQFLTDIKKYFMGDIIDTSFSKGKPIQMMPKVTIEKDVNLFKKVPYHSVGENMMAYITEISLYLTGTCSQNCDMCCSAFREFPYCTKKKNGKSGLDILLIKQLLEQLKISPLSNLNILGGNIFNYPNFEELTVAINYLSPLKNYYLHYYNLLENNNNLKYINSKSSVFKILVPSPINEEKLKTSIEIMKKDGMKSNYVFVVQSEEEFKKASLIISSLEIDNVDFQPFFNGENLDFFKKNIFTSKNEILGAKPSLKDIYANSVVNKLNFGRLTILSNGHIHANVNAPSLGILGKDSIYDVLYKEMYHGKSWRRIRKNVQPCKSCTFEALCPPLSNYTYAIGRNNLCHVMP